MTEFISRVNNDGDYTKYEITFSTDSEINYRIVQDACRRAIDAEAEREEE